MNTDIKKDLRRDSNINALLLIIFWLFYYAASLIIPAAVKPFKNTLDSSELDSLATLLFYIILYPIGFSVIFIIFRKISKGYKDQRIKTCFQKPQMPAGWVVKWIFLTIGATYAAAYISTFLFMIIEFLTGIKLSEVEASPENNSIGIMTTLISAPLFAPLFEELFFRGTLYRNVQKYGKWSMMIIAGFTFGIWHANYPQFLFAMTMGIFSCFLFEKTKSIIPSMIVHFIINSFGALMLVLLSRLGISAGELKTAEDMSALFKHPVVLMAMTFLGLIIIALLITWFVLMIIEIATHPESFRIEDRDESCLPGGQAFLTYITSPLMIIALLGMTALTVYRALGGTFI